MRSVFARILVWFLATIGFTVGAFLLVSALAMSDSRGRQTPFAMLLALQREQARSAYESGGAAALALTVARAEAITSVHGILTGPDGRDLVTGADYSALVKRITRFPFFPVARHNGITVGIASDDGRYFYLAQMQRRRWVRGLLSPLHLWVVALAVALCYLLAFQLTVPVKRLQETVERFGHGDWKARTGSQRKDEFGELGRAFDQMAERIETLLASERRLLLDISHELRSPLARLSVAVELARTGERRDQALAQIEKESERMNELIGQLLQVTRAENDPAALRHDPVALDELLLEVVEDGRFEAEARGCTLRLAETPSIEMTGDAELLRRAVENVVRNAIRFSPEGTAVEVAAERRGANVVMRIRDHGPGVPEDELPKIFEPFYRVETDRSRVSGGTGLGLSIARRAVDLHKGRITAKNAHPGLAVEIELPVGEAMEKASGGG